MSPRPSILYFASVYWDDPLITPQQIAMRLSARYDVLYVEPSPSAVYLRQPARNRRWLRVGRLSKLAEGLHVYSPPPMLPLKTRIPAFNYISHAFVRPFVRRAMRSVGMHEPVLFTYLPHLHAALGAYGERLVCYYCIDDMGALSRVIDPKVVAGYERALVLRANLVFTTSRGLQQRLGALHSTVHLVPNGSDPSLYERALADDTPIPGDVAGLREPVLGFSGLVDSRLDQALLAEVARRRPGWSFVFVGPVRVSVDGLAGLPNVRFVPQQAQAALPGYFRKFDVGLVPYVMGPMVRFIYPTKLNDYLAAGLPVVSTALPELDTCPHDIVARVDTADDLIAAVERLWPTRWDAGHVARRLAFAADNSWERRASTIADRIDAALAEQPPCA